MFTIQAFLKNGFPFHPSSLKEFEVNFEEISELKKDCIEIIKKEGYRIAPQDLKLMEDALYWISPNSRVILTIILPTNTNSWCYVERDRHLVFLFDSKRADSRYFFVIFL